MKTRQQLNKEYDALEEQIKKEEWMFEGAIISMVVAIAGMPIGVFLPTFGGWCIVLGFLGMIGFGGRCAHLSERKKELRQEWAANGYGLKKYPTR